VHFYLLCAWFLLAPHSTLLLVSSVCVMFVVMETGAPFPTKCRGFWRFVSRFSYLLCLCGRGSCSMEICASFPAGARFSSALSHTFAGGSVRVGIIVVSKRVHLSLLSAWVCWCFVPHFCLSAVFVRCAPFPAGAGCSGVSFRTSAVGSVCVGGFEVIKTCAPFPC